MTSEYLKSYYARRAREYETIYDRPERQNDLARIKNDLAALFAGSDVLEIACGTSYWTQTIAQTARSIVATDINPEVIEIARSRTYKVQPQFVLADAYEPTGIAGHFNALLAAFWWSHVPPEKLGQFLEGLKKSLPEKSLIVFLDNRYIPGSSTKISLTDQHGNTFQDRILADGSMHRILKNSPTANEIYQILRNGSQNLQVVKYQCYWMTHYLLRAS